MVRPPWSKRHSDQDISQFFVLREGVPDGLVTSLTDLVLSAFYTRDELMGGVVALRETINQFARITDRYLPRDPDEAGKQFAVDRGFLLDAVDFVLGRMHVDSYETGSVIAKVELALREARSAYTIGRDGSGQLELQYRQPEALTALVTEATSATDRASEHLRRAWSKAFARSPDPNGACVEAVAAIEVAAKPIVSPNNQKVTLGTLIRDMKAKPSKWDTASEADGDVEKVIAIMDMVWTGHYRHGDESKPVNVSAEGAEMIVQLSALLVHWFRSGRIRPRRP